MNGESFDPQNATLLVVDDTELNRRLYAKILSDHGFRVELAASGAEALARVHSMQPKLVLLDYMMPDLDGVAVLRAIRSDSKTATIPVVMLTASTEPDHIDLALAAGADDYLATPVSAKLLITRLRSLLQVNAAREQAARKQAAVNRRTDAWLEDLQEAAQVQQAQLPDVPFLFGPWLVSGAVAPSGLVGGDLFDIVPAKDSCFAVLLDVAGHGTASALIAAETRMELRHLLSRYELQDAVSRLNTHLALRAGGKYCCLAVVQMGRQGIAVLNAGLPAIAVIRGAEVHATIWGSGTPIGMFSESQYEITQLKIEPGDRVVLLSDGLTEPFDDTDNAAATVDRLQLWPDGLNAVPDGDELRCRVVTLAQQAAPEQRDDATVVVLSYSSPPSSDYTLRPQSEAIPSAVQWVLEQGPPWLDATAVDHGLTEALSNAVLHGALGLDSDLRRVGKYDTYLGLAASRSLDPDYAERRIRLRVVQLPSAFCIHLSWDGNPCPLEERYRAQSSEHHRTSNPDESGMGLRIIHSLFERVVWAPDGKSMALWMQRSQLERDRSSPHH